MDESTNTSYAEKYWANCLITVGSVVVISDNPGCEIRYSSIDADERVLGVVSVSDKTHPQIALRGRVAVKVTGEINRGDMLVTSDILGTCEESNLDRDYFQSSGSICQVPNKKQQRLDRSCYSLSSEEVLYFILFVRRFQMLSYQLSMNDN